MKLIDDWREKLNTLWSVKLAIFTALLAVADQVLALFSGAIPPLTYAVLAAAIIVVRVIAQPKPAAPPAA